MNSTQQGGIGSGNYENTGPGGRDIMFFALLVTLTSLFGSVTSLHAADHTVSIPDRFSYAVFANKSVILTGSSYLDSYGGTPERYVKGKDALQYYLSNFCGYSV